MEVKDCFVIMPFSKSASHTEAEWTEIFEKLFSPAWTVFDIDCHRTKVPRGSITKDIIEKLYSASIVFADLTDSNPNVMYELGVRHTFKKPSVMVKAKGSQIPFDVNDYNVFQYEYTPKGLEDLKNHIKIVIEDVKKYPNKSDNPVWDFRHTSDFLVDYYRNMENIQKLAALSEELASNLERVTDFLEAIRDIKIPNNMEECLKMDKNEEAELESLLEDFFPLLRDDAIGFLKVTRYTSFTDEDWNTLNMIHDFYRWCHFYSGNLAMTYFIADDKQKLEEMKKAITEGMNIVNKRILELESK